MHSAISRILYGNLKWAFVLFSLTSGQVLAQSAPAWTQAVSFGGSGSDSGSAVKVDAHGNRYVTGGFSSKAKFGDRVLDSAGGTDIFLAKFGRSGELLWLLQAGGPGDDIGNDIAFDLGQNIYVAGSFTDSATFPSVHGSAKTVTGVGQTIFLAKYHPTGELAWVQTGTISLSSNNEAFGVAVEPVTGTVFITGRTLSDTTFSSSDGTEHTVPGPFAWHMYLVKYDINGNFQWGQSNEASLNCIPHKVAVDAHNNAYVTGWLEGTTTFHSNDGHDLTITGLSQPVQTFPDFPDDAFIVKYDAEGNAKWGNLIGGYKGIGTDIAVSRYGKISITGFIGNLGGGTPSQVETIATSQPGGTNINLGGGQLTNPYNKDAFLATYDSAGVLLDARRIGGMQDDGGSGIAYDHKDNLYVAGVFQGTINVEGQTLTGEKPFNLFVLKFRGRSPEEQRKPAASAAAGGLAWVKKADGPGQDQFELNPRMDVTASGTVLVTGVYRDIAIFDAITLHSAGEEDIFLAELSAERDNDDCDGLGCGEQDDDNR
ncbi:MAG: SBBP repeat-containing protein [Candidatus Acidiferrum sp.]